MTLQIGSGIMNNFIFKNRVGVTLVETLAAIVILSIGIVAVYQPLLRSLTVLNDIDSRLEATRLAADELWLLKNSVSRLRSIALQGEQSQLVGPEHAYDYTIHLTPMTEDRILNKVDMTFYWKVSGQLKKLTHTCYVEIPIA